MTEIGKNMPDRQVDSNARFTFRKHERLCSQTAISQLIREGKTLNHYPFRLLYLEVSDRKDGSTSPVRLAISVPKRSFKRAVKRNLLKRRIREVYRINKSSLYQCAEAGNIRVNLLLVYVSAEIFPYNEIERKLVALLQRLSKRLEENAGISAHTAG
ncbi:MAG: ribonuclease P protein component [Prevotellaceae bacterium]|jgi:ribonuclease P protein component|nr:ribonuclease P protein component [Prevotellaceae bacterium]